MPIGDPPYYFDVPDILAEKRWPTRQELDAAAPNNPVFIRSIWGFWRAYAAARLVRQYRGLDTRRHHARHGLAGPDTLEIEKDANGDPTGVFIEKGMQPIAELIWFRTASRVHPRGSGARAAVVGASLSCLRHDKRVRGTRRRNRIAARLQGCLPRRHADHAHGAGVQPELEGGGRRGAGAVHRGLGRMARRARTRRRLAQGDAACSSSRTRASANDLRATASPYTGWAGFNYDTGIAARAGQGGAATIALATTFVWLPSPPPRLACSTCSKKWIARYRCKDGAG